MNFYNVHQLQLLNHSNTVDLIMFDCLLVYFQRISSYEFYVIILKIQTFCFYKKKFTAIAFN